ncbi:MULTISPECIES: [protein-PII] uridylyltransferase [Pandoraea]|uniref:Bifunctional uridylyltransferase/uridylyl-removing enzyme n=1 Tax=Pandoraea communis TaxID=2508297 RepID=A0A5E4VST7_9BURK|nr:MULTISPECIES: [protein-PII] uridylyltransferase [Pandoraea]EON15687.1 PII uridylyl-transferase [Pandoraea sp. SD6-2]VVE15053.1 protein-PII uridylyltransferase [Pandoraea communis]
MHARAHAPSPLRQALKERKAELVERFSAHGKIDTLLHGMCQAVDQAMREAWAECQMPGDLALVAVGGYGRGELYPHSDVDILLLHRHAEGAALTSHVEPFIGFLWDIGLEIGSSVRTVDECIIEAHADITVQTSLLEARLLTGNRALFDEFEQRFSADLDPRAFFRSKQLEIRQRHAKYQDTPYSLEPNCKESPGGLRDLQVILWMTKAAGLGNSWSELFARDLLTDRELKELRRNEQFLKGLRARLHLLARRRQDVLVFDMQTSLAQSLGFNATTTKRASEQLMRRYYWAAKAVSQLNTVLLLNVEARLFPQTSGVTRVINERFVEKQGMIEIVDDELYQRHPNAILETFLLYEQVVGVKGLSARTLRALYNARELMDAQWRADPENRRTFLAILQQPQGITHALRLMNQTSVLGRYLINFRRVVGQMQHDLYHVYTVDQHILMVVRNIRRFAVAEHTHEYPFCSQLIANFDRPWVLTIAALFHDIAKGRGGDHSTLGMADARRFCTRHGIDKEDTELIVWLVGEHLTMSTVAQKQDTTDPEVIRRFAEKVGNERRLTALYLLTVADIRGTSPKVWNAWKGKLLEDLYRLTLQVLGGANPDPRSQLKTRKEEALGLLRLYTVPERAQEALWNTLDVAYFLRNDPADVAWQTRHLWRQVDSAVPIVKARPSPIGEGLQVMVYVRDQVDLFARICGYFERKGLSILDAKVHTTSHGFALDSFLLTDPGLDTSYRDIINLVESELVSLLTRVEPMAEPNKGRLPRRSRSFPVTPRVDLRPDERGQYYLLSVSANDRTGLLYAVARVLARHGVSVRTARINTLGERVEDTFLLDGSRLQDNRLQIAVETELLEALEP